MSEAGTSAPAIVAGRFFIDFILIKKIDKNINIFKKFQFSL